MSEFAIVIIETPNAIIDLNSKHACFNEESELDFTLSKLSHGTKCFVYQDTSFWETKTLLLPYYYIAIGHGGRNSHPLSSNINNFTLITGFKISVRCTLSGKVAPGQWLMRGGLAG